MYKKKTCFEEGQEAGSRDAWEGAPPAADGVRIREAERTRWGGGDGWSGRAAGGPVVFPFASEKETKWEVECADCQQAGRPQRAPPPALEAHSRPEPALLAAAGPSRPAPARGAGPVSARLWLRLGRWGRARGSGASGTSGTGSRASPGAHKRCALAGCTSRVWREPGKGRPPGVAAGTRARTAPLRRCSVPCRARRGGLRRGGGGGPAALPAAGHGARQRSAACALPRALAAGGGGALAAVPLAVPPGAPAPARGEESALSPASASYDRARKRPESSRPGARLLPRLARLGARGLGQGRRLPRVYCSRQPRPAPGSAAEPGLRRQNRLQLCISGLPPAFF